MSFDPCREWLGIPAVELVSAHAVLGVGRGETDAGVIAAAAEERLRMLHGIAPGPFGKAHAALIARVVAARDEMLAAAPPAPRQAPVPPPVPSRAGFSGGSDAGATAEMPPIVIAGGPPRRRRSRSGGPGALLALVAVMAAAAAASVVWPRADTGVAREHGPPRKVAARSGAARPQEATTAASPHMAPRDPEDRPAAEPESPEPDPAAPATRSPPSTMATAERPLPDPAQPAAAPLPAAVDTALRKTFAALRRNDHAAARQAIDDARKAGGEGDYGGRVGRWNLLVTYAEQLAGHLEQAIASANEGREYQIGDRIISIIEISPTTYAFKERGQIQRGPRERLPKAIERVILEQWFAADGRAANHILLGVHLLVDDPSSLPDVRSEWEIAMAGEPATAAILPLLDDPLLAGSAE